MSVPALRQPPWMAHAWAELGQAEMPGPRSNPRIADFIRRVGHPQSADDATAWCAAFVGACLDRAGLPGTRSLMARSYLDWGVPAAVPEPGAIAVLSRGGDPALGHVGFLVGMTAEHAILLGGNQSDAVTVEAFARSRLLALRLPEPTARPGATTSDVPEPDGAFAWSLARILAFEGGFSDDPFDPGGPTNKGITLATYARFRGEIITAESHARLEAELRAIPDDLVARIYRERYWRPALCSRLPSPLAHFHFDAAVNQGVGGAARMLQEALGVEIDGEIGPLTLAAANGRPLGETLERYAAARRARYRALQHFWRFGRGWLSRVDKALAQAASLAANPSFGPSTPADAGLGTHSRTQQQEINRMPDSTQPTFPDSLPASKWWGSSLTIWGTLVTAITTVAPLVLAAFGLDLPGPLVDRLGTDLVAVVQAIGGLVGTVMTILGRARATSPLARRPVAIRI